MCVSYVRNCQEVLSIHIKQDYTYLYLDEHSSKHSRGWGSINETNIKYFGTLSFHEFSWKLVELQFEVPISPETKKPLHFDGFFYVN